MLFWGLTLRRWLLTVPYCVTRWEANGGVPKTGHIWDAIGALKWSKKIVYKVKK